MLSRWLPATLACVAPALVGLGLLAPAAQATTFTESGFVETSVASPRPNGSWSEAVGLTFSPSGRMFVWERGGRVWIVDPVNPVTQPFIDISEEVLGWRDHGFLGFALHPDFDNTGYVYLMYTVDRNHLMNCDSPANGVPSCNGNYIASDTWQPNQQFLDPPANTRPNPGYNKATIGRIIRLQAIKPVGDADYRRTSGVDYTSRKVLLGETFIDQPKSGGILLTHESHGVGSLVFGQDGTLLVTTGDNASYSSTDSGSAAETYWSSAIADGIMPAKENVGAFRSQMVDSLAGKVLRLDPETGNGVPSNPFYDAAAPRSAKSRVWALGLRNPYRMAFRPGTGSHLPQQGNPGSFYIGDVGYVTWEDLHVLRAARENFGWPLFEGLTPNTAYTSRETQNPDAPNPLGGGSCPPNFRFKDLIKQETSGTLSFPNPCNTSQQIPLTVDVFGHSRPALDWQHGVNVARWGSFDASGNAVAVTLGQTYNGKTIPGIPFAGNASTGGVWYQGTDFPSQYRNTYFQGDYGGQWIRNFVFDSNDNLTEVRNFATGTGGVVALATHPQNGQLFYIEWASFVRKVSYNATKPVALAVANPTFGNSPLVVSFNGSASYDPQGQPLTYLWDFGDGTTSTAANPTKTYSLAPGQTQNFTVSLTVRDVQNLTDQAFLVVAVNNTPPAVNITSPADGGTYSAEVGSPTTVNLNALISDAESPNGQLFCAWTVILNHNNHTHQDPAITDCTSAVVLTPVGCDGETYSYTLRLDVTDPQGLTGSDSVTLQPACTGTPTDTAAPSVPGTPQAQVIGQNRIDLAWTGSTDTGGSGLAGYRIYRNGATTPLVTVTGTTYSDQNLTPATGYTYRVSAFDFAGNESALSGPVTATTAAPPVWTNQDIGTVGIAGSLTDSNGTLTVAGSGADIWGTRDAFHFAYQSLSGDGEIIARVTSMTNTDPWAKGGVMIRESTANNARFAMMLMTPGTNGAAFQYRTTTGGSAAPSNSADLTSRLPRWVRLTRSGNLIRGFTSADGINWVLRNSITIAFPQTVLIGLAHTSHQLNVLGSSTFDNVAIVLPAPDTTAPGVPGTPTGSAPTPDRIDLAWTASTDEPGGSGLAGYRIYRNGGSTAHATVTAPATTYSDTGLAANTTYSYRVSAFDVAGNESVQSAPLALTTPSLPPPDTTPPNAPTGLTATAAGSNRVNLAWNAATDPSPGSGVTGYRVYRNGGSTPVATVTGTSYADQGLAPNTAYAYQVSAVDGAGNESTLSNAANATTAAPSSWSNQDIGTVGAAGSYTDNGTSIAVTGSGADIWGSADGFHFVHRTLTGDGEIIARVVSLTNTDPNAKAGVMFRESLTANSRFALTMMTPGSNGGAFQYRLNTGGSAAPSNSNDKSSTLPRWVRLVREGNVFRGFFSTDGVNWTLRNSITIAMPATVYVGLAVTSHNNATSATGTFDNVSLTTAAADTTPPSVPTGLTATAERRYPLTPVTTVATGLKPHSIATGDVNGDGFVDLVSGNSDSNTASVLLGNGAGSFTLASSPAVGLKPKTTGLADVNGDGKLDLLAGNQDSNTLSVLIGNGNGTFQPAVNYAACPRPHELATGDFNGDGWPDVAVACQFNTTVVGVFINNGAGGMLPMVSYTAGSRPHSVVVADFNQDGKLDLAVANYGESTIGILAGNGNGTFGTSVKYATGSGPHSLRTADLNGDGRLDLVAVNDGSNTASVLLGNPGGTFAARVDYPVGSVPKGVALGDVDGDGIVDIISANTGGSYPNCCVASGGNNVSVLTGRGDGTFNPRYEHTVGRTPFAAEVLDLNGDGRKDIVTANYDDANLGLVFAGASQHQVRLNWTAATDPSPGTGVAGYRIFRDGQSVGTTSGTTYVDPGLAAATTYQYAVAAYDAGSPPNQSAPSPAISVTTQPNN